MKLLPKAILVAVDVRDPADNVLQAAEVLAGELGAKLCLAYVQPPPAPEAYGAEAVIMVGDDAAARRIRVRRKLAKLAAGLRGVDVSVRGYEGRPEDVLSKLAASGSYGLVLLGTHGYSGVRRVVFGSVAEAVVRASSVPVLTMPPHARLGRPRNVLAPYNMAPHAARALRAGADLAWEFGGRVTALFVSEGRPEAALARRLAASAGRAAGRLVLPLVRSGNPIRCIIDEAESWRYDILVLAAHRKSFWKDMLLGTTAERVLRHCPIPVLAVPSGRR